MTDAEFKKALGQFKYYLKPDMFATLMESSDVFSDEGKQEIIAKLEEADKQMHELNDYSEERITILQKGVKKIGSIYNRLKATYRQFLGETNKADEMEAEKIISNL